MSTTTPTTAPTPHSVTVTLPLQPELLHTVFVTALEGGIGYWSVCDKYRWAKEDAPKDASVEDSSDLVGFHAIIRELDEGGEEEEREDYDGYKSKEIRIDSATIALGIQRLLSGQVKVHSRILGWLLAGVVDYENAGNIDSDVADCVVQAAVFNEVVYG